MFDPSFRKMIGKAADPSAGAPPEIPTVSEWAEKELQFKPDRLQKSVLDRDARRLILCCARQWGKTTVIALKALHTAIFQPRCEIAVISQSLKQASLLLSKVRESAAILGLRGRRIPGFDESLQLPNGSKIFGIANSEKSTRGYTASIVIVDEAALVGDDVIGAATPTLSRTNGQLWLLSTPHGQTGLFYDVWHDKTLSGWFKCKATIEDASYATPEYITEQARLFPFTFRQEFYCEFIPPKGSLLSRERVEKMIDPTIDHVPFPRFYKEPA